MAFFPDENVNGNAIIFCMGEAGAKVADLAAAEWPQGLSQVKCVVWPANEGTVWSEEVQAEVEKAETVMVFADAEDHAAAAAAKSIMDAANRSGVTVVCIVTKDEDASVEDHRMGKTPENSQEAWESASVTAWLPRKANERPEELLWPVFRLAVRLVFEDNVVNLAVEDICSILAKENNAYVGVGSGKGINKAEEAARTAISSLCAKTELSKVRNVIIGIAAPSNIEPDDIDKCSEKIIDSVHPEAIFVWGAAFDDRMNDEMAVTVLVTNSDAIDAKLDALLKQLNSRPAEDDSHASKTSADQDPHQTAMICKQKAEQGDVEAMTRLAKCYGDGVGLERDEEQAFWWCQKAAEQGYGAAQFLLGSSYGCGMGVNVDRQKANEWYRKAAEGCRKAAEQGDAEAQYNLGLCYESGYWSSRGVPWLWSNPKALEWYRKSAEQDCTRAQYHLGCCYAKGIGVPQDDEKAAKWYLLAAERGDSDAQNKLGLCYDSGKGVKRNLQKALEWFLKAAKQNHAAAQYNLGLCYANGDGVPQDDQKAVEWYRKAAEQGDAEAQNALGHCYENGIGVPRDDEKAAEWYRKAKRDDMTQEIDEFLALLNNPGTDRPRDDEKTADSTAATP